jgi:hypothetical protein
MGSDLVLVIIQQTKSAEPVRPVQHFFFDLFKLGNRKLAVSFGMLIQCNEQVYMDN